MDFTWNVFGARPQLLRGVEHETQPIGLELTYEREGSEPPRDAKERRGKRHR